MQNHGKLRIIGFEREGMVQLMCLETGRAISRPTRAEAEREMEISHVGYFGCFSEEEMREGKYLQPAPFSYRLRWNLVLPFLHNLFPSFRYYGELLPGIASGRVHSETPATPRVRHA